MSPTRRGPAIAAGALALFLALVSCGGHDNGMGAPPGHGGPPGGGHRGGGIGAPYTIPPTVLLIGTIIDARAWPGIQARFWSECPGGTHCVNPRLVPITKSDLEPCEFDHVDPPVGTRTEYHTTIRVYVGAPCPPDDSPGGSAPPDSVPPQTPDGPSPGS